MTANDLMDFLLELDGINIGEARLWSPSKIARWLIRPRHAEKTFKHKLSGYHPKSFGDNMFNDPRILEYLMCGKQFIVCVIKNEELPEKILNQWPRVKEYEYFWAIGSACYKEKNENDELDSIEARDRALETSDLQNREQLNFLHSEIRLVNVCYTTDSDKIEPINLKIPAKQVAMLLTLNDPIPDQSAATYTIWYSTTYLDMSKERGDRVRLTPVEEYASKFTVPKPPDITTDDPPNEFGSPFRPLTSSNSSVDSQKEVFPIFKTPIKKGRRMSRKITPKEAPQTRSSASQAQGTSSASQAQGTSSWSQSSSSTQNSSSSTQSSSTTQSSQSSTQEVNSSQSFFPNRDHTSRKPTLKITEKSVAVQYDNLKYTWPIIDKSHKDFEMITNTDWCPLNKKNQSKAELDCLKQKRRELYQEYVGNGNSTIFEWIDNWKKENGEDKNPKLRFISIKHLNFVRQGFKMMFKDQIFFF